MLRDIREWFELQAAILAYRIIYLSGLYWLIVVAGKFFTREPLLYNYSTVHYTQETVPVAMVTGIQLLSLAYQLLTRTLFGRAADSVVLYDRSPKIAGISMLVFLLWASSGPAPGSSYLPLAALTAASIFGALAVRKGPMSRDRERASTTTSAEGQPQAAERVTRVLRPERNFTSIHGNQELKRKLLQAASALLPQAKRTGGEQPRNGILLYGLPGNGKTAVVEALAGELRLPLLVLTPGDVASKWVGEKTSRVRMAFREAMLQQPCVLFLDEVDSFLESREVTGAGTVKEDRDLVNALLTLIVEIRQSKVLLIAATNHLERLDGAAIREGRFDFKVEVPPPDREARLGLLVGAAKRHLPGVAIPADLLEAVAGRWNGYSTKRLLAIMEELPNTLRRQGRDTPDFQSFMSALRMVQGHSAARLENGRSLGELALSERTRRGLDNLYARMADPERTERNGGTLPTGVLFFGPPGTGKTAAARALAKELAWTFLPVTGAELARDVAALDRLYAKAMDLRPSLIFLDEADDLLRDRDFSVGTASTNKLLTLMDGVADRVVDVVWIAATNHLDQVDAAVLRGGRFSEKVGFELPSAGVLAAHVGGWLGARQIRLEPSFDVEGLTELLGAVSIANAEAVVQAAVNLSIGRGAAPVVLTRRDFLDAIELVLG